MLQHPENRRGRPALFAAISILANFLALFASNVTIANGTYTSAVLWALLLAVVSAAFAGLFVIASRSPWRSAFFFTLVPLAYYTIDNLIRRLPGILARA